MIVPARIEQIEVSVTQALNGWIQSV